MNQELQPMKSVHLRFKKGEKSQNHVFCLPQAPASLAISPGFNITG